MLLGKRLSLLQVLVPRIAPSTISTPLLGRRLHSASLPLGFGKTALVKLHDHRAVGPGLVSLPQRHRNSEWTHRLGTKHMQLSFGVSAK